jgi:signal peptidase I
LSGSLAVVLASWIAGCGGKSITVVLKTPSEATANRHSPARLYRVPSGSMEPTLSIGARVVVEEGPPKVGEIVVFHPPEGAEQAICGPTSHRVTPGSGSPCGQSMPNEDATVDFIKRIVAGPGDEIYVHAGHVYRKAAGAGTFTKENDSYTSPCQPASLPECNFPTPVKIPTGDWFMMGDNRGHSDDSRFWGAIPAAWIVGVVRRTG